jgi:hypothetical protein
MKNILYSTCLVMMLVMSSSCNKWLDLQPRDGITRQEFWKTKEDVLAAVSGCYTSLLAPPPGIGDKSLLEYMFMYGELRADMIAGGPSITTEETDIINVNITQDNTTARWAAFYRTINYCNTVLDFAPGVKATDPHFYRCSIERLCGRSAYAKKSHVFLPVAYLQRCTSKINRHG